MNLRIDSQSNGMCHMSLTGRISQTTLTNQADPLQQLLGEANFGQQILLSLRQTDHIDSSGIGWLLATDKKLRQAGGGLVLHSVPNDVQHVLTLMRLDKVLHIAKDKTQAETLASGDSQHD